MQAFDAIGRKILRSLHVGAPLILFIGIFIYFLNSRYPVVGHDFDPLPYNLFAGRWHFHRSGISPLWYIPFFCGGVVSYGNPHDMFYSLTQLLSFFTTDWIAVNITIICALLLGYWAWFIVGKRILRLENTWSHVFALCIITNGYYFIHIVSGHYSFYMLPLQGFLVYLLFSRTTTTWIQLFRDAIAFAFLSAVILYGGNWSVLLFFFLLVLLILPFDLVIARIRGDLLHRMKQLIPRGIVFLMATLLLCASKIVAVGTYLSVYPRTRVLDAFSYEGGVLSYIVKAFWFIPQRESYFAGIPWGIHEKSALLSPIILVGLLVILPLALRYRSFLKKHWPSFVLSSLLLIWTIVLMVQFVRGYGPLTEFMHKLPIFSSQHVATRYIYVFSLPITLLGVWGMASYIKKIFRPRISKLFAIVSLWVTVGAFYVGYSSLVPSLWYWSDMGAVQAKLRAINLDSSVETIVDASTISEGESCLYCSEPILSWAGAPQTKVLIPGSVTRTDGKYFNLMNPSCYIFPDENSCDPGDRILVSDFDNFERFRNGGNVSWKISSLQHVANWMSLTTLSITLGLFLSWLLFFFINTARSQRSAVQKKIHRMLNTFTWRSQTRTHTTTVVLFWLHSMIFFLASLSIFEIGQRMGIVESKNWEMKIYFMALAFGALLPLLRIFKNGGLLGRRFTWYELYLSFFIPAGLLQRSVLTTSNDFLWWGSVLGFIILIFNVRSPVRETKKLKKFAQEILVGSVVLSSFLLVFPDQNSMFTFTPWILPIVFLSWVLLRLANEYTFLIAVLFLLFAVLLGSVVFINGVINVHHYSFYIGPVIEFMFGNRHPLSIDAQYGSGITLLLGLFFKFIPIVPTDGLSLLLCLGYLFQYILIFFISVKLLNSKGLALFTSISILFFDLFAREVYVFGFPSTGPLRFGLPYIILALYCLPHQFHSRYRDYAICFLGVLALFWSFETAIYTIPALLAAEYVFGTLGIFLRRFMVMSAVGMLVYLSPFLGEGSFGFERYFEYAQLYIRNPFFLIPLSYKNAIWWLFPPLYAFWIIQISSRRIIDGRIVFLTVYGIMIFTYFLGRSHINNLHHISIPFILLLFLLIKNNVREYSTQCLLVSVVTALSLSGNYLNTQSSILRDSFGSHFDNYSWQIPRFRFYTKEMPQTCAPDFLLLREFLIGNSLPLLDARDETYGIYECLRVHNTFGINPYFATEENPKAVLRVLKNIKNLDLNHVIVRTADENRELSKAIIGVAGVVRDREFTIANVRYVLYRKG